tara:strand:+ start:3796 stop:3963 length:168 start_codon:yes stop_codon:yes gene_type:complete
MKKYKLEVVNLTSKKCEIVEVGKEYSVYNRKTRDYTVISSNAPNYDSQDATPKTK